MRWIVCGLLSVGLCSGCAGVSPAQVGQTAGTIAGAAIAPGAGAPIGALAGLLVGMVVQGQVDKVTEKRERKELSQEFGKPSTPPADGAIPPHGQQTRVWVDEAFQDGRLKVGHFEVRYL